MRIFWFRSRAVSFVQVLPSRRRHLPRCSLPSEGHEAERFFLPVAVLFARCVSFFFSCLGPFSPCRVSIFFLPLVRGDSTLLPLPSEALLSRFLPRDSTATAISTSCIDAVLFFPASPFSVAIHRRRVFGSKPDDSTLYRYSRLFFQIFFSPLLFWGPSNRAVLLYSFIELSRS